MPILEKLLEWSKTLPLWQQDAIRRIFQGDLSNADKSEVMQLLKAQYKLVSDCKVTPRPLTDIIAPIEDDTSRFSLAKLHSIKDVNKIHDGESIGFCTHGLTIIYGDNASGKSGYGRIFNRACRSRHPGKKILGNLFGEQYDPDSCAQATFDIQKEGCEVESITWSDSDIPNDTLARIAVFDKQCVRVHVSEEQKVDFVPYGADVFEDLSALLGLLKQSLKAEVSALPVLPGSLLNIPADTAAGKFIAALSARTKEPQIDTVCTLTEQEKNAYIRLGHIKAERDAHSPSKIAEKENRIADRYKWLVGTVINIFNAVSDAKCSELKQLRKAYIDAKEAAKHASKEGFTKEPLPGIGSDTWRAMFEAARDYAEQEAYQGKKFTETFESRCVLCQQPLISKESREASDRMKRFEVYVQGKLSSLAKQAQTKVIQARDTLNGLNVEPLKGLTEFEAELKNVGFKLFETLASVLSSARQRRTALVSGLVEGKWKKLASWPDVNSFIKSLKELEAKHRRQAEAALKQEPTEEQKAQMLQYRELHYRTLAGQARGDIIRFVKGLNDKVKLEACIRDCDTTPVSRMKSKVMKEAVTDQLCMALGIELKALGVSSIKPFYRGSSPKGAYMHQIGLEGMKAPDVKLDGVLSEGEGLVVAIASFLAELSLAPQFCVIVFDDPVCSLDHYWRANVAERLAKLSLERQVVIFTHDLAFVFELTDYLTKECKFSDGKKLDDFVKLFAIGSSESCAGLILPEGSGPMEMLSTEKRIGKLIKLCEQARVIKNKESAETYREFIKSAYTLYRRTVERAIEGVLFGDVVVRFRESVHVQRLPDVARELKLEDCKFFFDAWDKASSLLSGHDTPMTARGAVPTPDQFQEDINKLKERCDEIKQKRDTKATNVTVATP